MSNVVRRNLLRIILALPLMLGLMSTTAFAADDPLTGSWRLVKRKLPDGTIQTSPAVGGMSTTTVSGVNHKNVFWQTPDGHDHCAGGGMLTAKRTDNHASYVADSLR